MIVRREGFSAGITVVTRKLLAVRPVSIEMRSGGFEAGQDRVFATTRRVHALDVGVALAVFVVGLGGAAALAALVKAT